MLLVAALLLTLCGTRISPAPHSPLLDADDDSNISRRQDDACEPVRFTSQIPTWLCAKRDQWDAPPPAVFTWTGGNGRYSFFKVPRGASQVRIRLLRLTTHIP